MVKREIKSIGFNATLKGKGIVNFDGDSQKKYLRINHKDEYDFESLKNDNGKFAKKNFYKDYFKLKISSDCLKRSIFGEDIDGVNSTIMYSPMVLNNFLATPHGILRGYMFAQKEDGTLKRKSVVTLTDAEQSNEVIPYMEFFSKGDENRKTSETSLYASETCGNIEYETKGFFSIKRLQFISSSPFFDREAVKDDELNENGLYLTALKRNFGEDVNGSEHGYFTINKNIFVEQIAETGLLLSQNLQKQLFKDFFTRFLNMRIERGNAYCELKNLTIKLVFDPLGGEDGYETREITTISDLDNIINEFDFKQYYEKANADLVEKEMQFMQEKANEKSGRRAELKGIQDKIKKINKEIKDMQTRIEKDYKDDEEGFKLACGSNEELISLIKEREELENTKKG